MIKKKMIFITLCLFIGIGASVIQLSQTSADLATESLARQMDKSIKAFWIEGGTFHHEYDGDLWGVAMFKTVDNPADPRWAIDDKGRPNKPVVSIFNGIADAGIAFLEAYNHTGNKLYLYYALKVGKTLLSIQKDMPYPGWSSHAVVVPPEVSTTEGEVGHWTTAASNKDTGDLSYPPRATHPYVTFDDGISTNGGMFLIELYDVIKALDFSSGVNPLDEADIIKGAILTGATAFFDLLNGYQTFELAKRDFENVRIKNAPVSSKNGAHPFREYLARLPSRHPLKRGRRTFQPYNTGGFPQGVRPKKDQLKAGSKLFGAKAAGYRLHKTLNDNEMSKILLFLLRYYEVTEDSAALTNLNKQLDWLVKVFRENDNRAWCQQYHVLDDKCAPARPWEAPSFAIPESVMLIDTIAYIEKTLEENYGKTHNNDIQQMLENAIYYIHKVIRPDTAHDRINRRFRFYALGTYNPTNSPTANKNINSNDPLYACDYYYTDDPDRSKCVSPTSAHSYNYYLIENDFETPAAFIVDNYSAGNALTYLIKDPCITEGRASFTGCLDFNKPKALEDKHWDIDLIYWGVRLTESMLNASLPNDAGLWTSIFEDRTVINTNNFKKHIRGMAALIDSSELSDSDLDGVPNGNERIRGTDPYYPDNLTPEEAAGVEGPLGSIHKPLELHQLPQPFLPTPDNPTDRERLTTDGPTLWDPNQSRTEPESGSGSDLREEGGGDAEPSSEPQVVSPPEINSEDTEEPLSSSQPQTTTQQTEEAQSSTHSVGGCSRVKDYLLH